MRKMAIVIGTVLLAGCETEVPVEGGPLQVETDQLQGGIPHAKVCGDTGPGEARCHAHVVIDGHGAPQVNTGPSGYGPADLQAAYSLSSSMGGSGQTVAIVDAYDNPNVEADLGAYRSQFGLPPCTTANGCFRKVDQNGGTNYPRGNTSWGQEIALDVDMVSAVCPNCKILLVEANSAYLSDLGAAVNTAVALGANVVSNSYGANEYASEGTDSAAYYNHANVVITVSSGDSGYGAEFPASSQYVVAVGGTKLTKTNGLWSETAWTGAGSGCSAYIAKPAWQTDSQCTRRTVADVSAVADPSTGVAVYDSYGSRRGRNWMVFGGTSVAAPLIGSVYALAGNAATGGGASFTYANASALHDITAGSNGSCGGGYLCTAVAGYDGPTGLGTPNGTNAF